MPNLVARRRLEPLIEIALYCLLAGTLLSQPLRDVAAAALLALLVLERLAPGLQRGEASLSSTWAWSVGALLGANVLSASVSEDPRASFEKLAFYPIGCLIFLGVRRVVTAGGFSRLATIVVLLVTLFAFEGTWQGFTGWTPFHENAPLWGRFQGALRYPSDVSLLPLLLAIGSEALIGHRRTGASVLVLALVAAAVSLSGTRSAWCALLLLVGASVWAHRRLRFGLGLIALVLAVSLGAASLGGASALDRLVSAKTYRAEKRLAQWQAAWLLFRESPLLGHGPHSFHDLVVKRHQQRRSVFARIDPSYAPYPHSIYLEALSGTGILGLAALALVLGQGLRTLYRRRAQPAARGALMSLSLFAAIGLFDMSLAKDWVQLCFWLPLGIAASVTSAAAEPAAPARPR